MDFFVYLYYKVINTQAPIQKLSRNCTDEKIILRKIFGVTNTARTPLFSKGGNYNYCPSSKSGKSKVHVVQIKGCILR